MVLSPSLAAVAASKYRETVNMTNSAPKWFRSSPGRGHTRSLFHLFLDQKSEADKAVVFPKWFLGISLFLDHDTLSRILPDTNCKEKSGTSNQAIDEVGSREIVQQIKPQCNAPQ